MVVSVFAPDFRSVHSVFRVLFEHNEVLMDRMAKAWPAASGVVLVDRRKQRCTRNGVNVYSVLPFFGKLGRKRWLGPIFLGYFIRDGSKITTELFIARFGIFLCQNGVFSL